MHFDHKTLALPVHPGDTLYEVDTVAGYVIDKEICEYVLLSEDGIFVMAEYDEEPREINQHYFLTEAEAIAWRDQNIPDPPLPYGRDALSWMDYKKWKPYYSGFKYVKIRRGNTITIREGFYFDGDNGYDYPTPEKPDGKPGNPGFYETQSKDAVLLEDVVAWIDVVMDMDEAMRKPDFHQTTDTI